MSPNNSETNDEPRRDDFMAHEEGTQSNSEFNHQQMCLSKSMLEQSEIRQQRSQACKQEGSTRMAERGTPINFPWDENSFTHPLPVPTQRKG
ncbi:hypothetical protein O181_044799 [Austropuccinia psidii MF-1]|uniref:Uncharacterized protein n=1 Tax=Austropuccinia psidii MF-1 TaxID=1389203 RepID=A0A9Q3DKQ4_9BASI|nr:hypothetical protein [Austropuccinia psidii MF-1]